MSATREDAMKRFLIGLLIVGSVLAAIALIARRRSGSGADDWDTFADDTYARGSKAASKVSDTAKDAASKVSDTAKDAASKVPDTAKDAAAKVSDTAKNAASKVSEAAKNV
jgi:gas vesicle protein